ncbi:MAG: thioredoxin family protein [Flavobacteriales bacterium]|jgi:thioredoxin-related protein|nr:thioredoxin family protein [Flavobacteriales bacterium]
MKNFVCIIFIFLAGLFFARAQSDDEIDWKSWPELEQAIKEKPKPVFIFFHAKWCAYCEKIKREIFTKPEVIKKLNTAYYAVEMDVERTDSINFEGMQFTNKQALTKRNGVHEIPLLLASREGFPFSLPATVILNKDFTIKERFFEYYTSKRLLNEL